MTAARGEFRFGVNLLAPASRAEWVEKCRRAEELGYDVVGVADHLGLPAPFPAMILAAEATERVRLTTFVLNAPFYNPVLLAREVATADRFTDGRVELGLGAGYVQAEFEAAGIAFDSGRERVEQLASTVETLRRLFADPEYQPRPAQPAGPPLVIAGWGDRLLRVAAEHADIIALTGAAAAYNGGPLQLLGPAAADERIAYLRGLLGSRLAEVELNILLQRVVPPNERAAALDQYGPHLPADVAEHPEELPALLIGTPKEMARQLEERRERFGFSYVTVLENSLEELAPVIELLR
ncbi:LLM class F420-dependent oxidoreductase [Nocardia sp. NBC_00565]|uniref:LLM class F420-dependent oxidoreductase n=1 Tax=Nocardia sp. NBC_00565 TaxID=2975993 RepID=UPI002E812DC9|nr:LLM class F420-dependent oxidoreductase [Nocardia sp. NBC_00565]WUC05986.1 LLM class F420-dependent oxidoreductase [Nocardia sp. NBC_00565]